MLSDPIPDLAYALSQFHQASCIDVCCMLHWHVFCDSSRLDILIPVAQA